jgi:RimJ/RimL family protein N-acetyltransferase
MVPKKVIALRDVISSDLPHFFEFQRDALAVQMTGFPPRNRESFDAHWKKILADEKIIIKTVLHHGFVAGGVLCFENGGEMEIGYWLGREFWGSREVNSEW